MKKLLLLILVVSAYAETIAQGCVAIRGTGAVCTRHEAGVEQQGWQFTPSYRYFKSFRHFVGKEEQHERMENNTEVINWQHTLNLNLQRQFNSRWSLALDVPLLTNKRSSLYEHGGNAAGPSARHNTNSAGVGDIRITGYRWLLNPARSTRGNIQAGLGFKLPTGNYKVKDKFYKADRTILEGPVDQSIQLGDGGFGVSTEINTYYNFTQKVGVYGNFFYLINPREENGVSTARGGTPNQTAIDYKTTTMSVPDQYMLRAGANVTFGQLTASAGMRYECVPSSDLFGGDEGFRRPGYVLSVEPGVSYALRRFVAFATVPVAVERNRTQSNADKLRTAATGTYAHGDAAFADYAINIGASFRF